MKSFRCFQLARSFYLAGKSLSLPAPLSDQWKRASSSIALNLAEGWGKKSRKDRERYFQSAFGSIRECQAILALECPDSALTVQLDVLAASVYRLVSA